MGIVNLSFVTDSDAGQNLAEAVDASVVLDRLRAAKPRIIAALSTIVGAIDADYRPPQLVPTETIRAILSQPVTSDA